MLNVRTDWVHVDVSKIVFSSPVDILTGKLPYVYFRVEKLLELTGFM